nr:DUF6470 family protein [Siminovitchia thermophila]
MKVKLPQIRLESEMGKIAVYLTQGKHSMHHVQPLLEIEQPPAELEIERTPAKLTIDQTKAWEDMNLKHVFRSIEENTDHAQQEYRKGVARRVDEGDEMMKIEDKNSNPIPEIAKRNIARPLRTPNITFIPSFFSVKMSYEKAKLDYNWKVHQPRFEARFESPVIEYEPGEVIVEMVRRPSLKIDVVNLPKRRLGE